MKMTAFVLAIFVATYMAASAELKFHVTDSAGKAVIGATTAIVPAGRRAEVTDGLKLDEDPNYVLGKTDAQGNVTLKTDAADFLVLILHESGYANLDRESAMKTHDLVLTRWGRIEGELRVGSKPGGAEPLAMNIDSDEPEVPGVKIPKWWFTSETTSDANGKFVFEHVPAGRVGVRMEKVLSRWSPAHRPQVTVEVKPEQTAHMTIGGTGRPVVGKIILPAEILAEKDRTFVNCELFPRLTEPKVPMPANIAAGSIAEQAQWWKSFRGSEAQRAYNVEFTRYCEQIMANTHGFEVAADGSFRVEGVAPGRYRLQILGIVLPPERTPLKRLDEIETEIVVDAFEGERTDSPMQLAPIDWNANIVRQFQAGEVAPEFSVRGFDGSTIKLSDFRGKFVVLDFWATWCGPCMAELPNVTAAQRKLAKDPRVVFISLSLDDQPDAPMGLIKKEKLDWKQGFLGEFSEDKVSKSYGVNSIPSLWLIGPDGRVIDSHVQGEDLLRLVNESLHPTASTKPSAK